ncbi:S46 family peptidase [Sphingomonas sp. SUN039]|uniref:S46 family peptidase n=1 Tax=Sphingomonas sp. SUN039 TaxID=2937787 RepID=UPI002164B3F9|nr:S46 family peptidase [Sphingomonas sp. SUN039]UVO54177.1 S46 family peptidase [Sphingomonas sp. SUN039]
MFRTLAMLTLPLIPAAAIADEGMWLPSQTGQIGAKMKERGLQMDPAKLGDFKAAPLNAIVSLGGCSAAFLSNQGLVATNHHCVYGSVQYNSKAGQDYLTDGFTAKTLADELPADPGARIYAIEDLRDVTKAMNAGLTASMSGRARYDRLDANRKGLIAACEKQPSRRCDVRPYYGGALYLLQQQLEIKDVRLVYAPPSGVGNFGGETDNWMWPRHTGDWGFYRAYVAPDGSSATYSKDNVPYRNPAKLTVAREGVKDGDFVMVAGFPGVTNRLATAAEAKFNYATFAPTDQKMRSDYADLILRETAGDREADIRYASIVRGVENYKKKILGEIAGADAIDLNARKASAEAAYRGWIAGDAARTKLYGASVAALDAVVAEDQAARLDALRTAAVGRAQLLSAARNAYRWAKEHTKPDAARENGYQDRDRAGTVARLTGIERRYVARVDRAILAQALGEYAKAGAGARNAAFEAAIKEIGLDRLYADTKLGDTATRVGWLDKTPAEFEASTDPFIRLAVAMYAGDIAAEAKAKDRSGRMQAARSVYLGGMRAWGDATGKPLYPDANGSLRFTYGNVGGRTKDGQTWTPFTTAEGIIAKQTGKGDFNAPAPFIAALKRKDWGPYAHPTLKTLPINYLSNVDITNGNSGSSTLNAKGEFVGLAFDGTLDGVIADWAVDPALLTTIHADSRFMLWTMDKVDGAGRLLTEMGVR